MPWSGSTRPRALSTPHRPDGVIDLDGIVKALAIQAGGELLLERGYADFSLNVGGDILVSGRPDGTSSWVMGIIDPADRSTLLGAVDLDGSRRAIATSGTGERGEHVWRGGTPKFVQVTVAAADIVHGGCARDGDPLRRIEHAGPRDGRMADRRLRGRRGWFAGHDPGDARSPSESRARRRGRLIN